MFKAKTIISLAVVLCMFMVSLTPAFAAVSTTTVLAAATNDSHTFTDSEGNDVRVDFVEKGDTSIVKVYVNDIFDHQVTTETNSGDMTLEKANGEKEFFNVSDFVKHIKVDNNSAILEDDPEFSALASPSYPFIKREYSSTWEAWGYLYGDTSWYLKDRENIEISKGTLAGVLYAIVRGLSIKNYIYVAESLAVISGGVIIDNIDAILEIYKKTYDYEVWVNNILGLKTQKYDYYSKADSGDLGDQLIYSHSGGDTRSESDMIHAGIYNVIALGMD